MKRPFDAYARSTDPKPGAVPRLVARDAWPGEVLRHGAREPRAGALTRLIARRSRRRRWFTLAPVATGALALVCAALLVRAVLLVPAVPERTVEAHLEAAARVERVLTEHARVAYVGAGAVSGSVREPVIVWELGTLEVEVEPGRGQHLRVETPEGRVEVVGTGFTVTRDPLGTTVGVRHGRVRVTCQGSAAEEIATDDTRTCLPTRPAGMLGRARALRRASAPTDAVLEAVERGLALGPDGPIKGELTAFRLDVLLTAARYDDALETAEAYLRTGDLARRADVQAIADELRARK